MPKIRVNSFAISLDGYGAGPNQGVENPLGVGGDALHDWLCQTRTFKQMVGEGVDDAFMKRGMAGLGAWVLGRNMFGPVRGPWPDENWKGWWGDTPPYHTPVFVLTHHPRPPLAMDGGTTFHFVTDGLEAALRQAIDAAGGKDVRVGGGVATVRACLQARLIDEMHVAIGPVVLGQGEHLLAGLDTLALGYECTEHVTTPRATHFVLARRA